MKGFFTGVWALVLGITAIVCLYTPYLYYTQGAIGFPLFLLGCLPAWVLFALMDNGNGKRLPFRFVFWAVVLVIWFAALFYLNANFEGALYQGLVIVHFFSLWAAVYVGDAVNFRLTRNRTKREIKQSTDVDGLRSYYLDNDWIAPELKKAAQKRIYELDVGTPQPPPEPPKAKASPKPKQTKPKAKPPQKPKPKPAPKTDEEAVFERRVFDDPDEEKPKAKVRVEPEPKHKGGNSRREKLEALAQDENAPPDERIAALNKLKDLKDD